MSNPTFSDRAREILETTAKPPHPIAESRYDQWILMQLTDLNAAHIEAVVSALPVDFCPDGHDKEACLLHEKYTSACCGCQKQQTRVRTIEQIKSELTEGETDE